MKLHQIFAISICWATVLLTSCEALLKVPIPGCTDPHSFNYDPEATESDGNCLKMYGCTGYQGGYANSGHISTSIGNTYVDGLLQEEIGYQRAFFQQVPAQLLILFEPSAEFANCYANAQGELLVGYHFFQKHIGQYNELAVAGVMAHEYGHRVQFQHFQQGKWFNDYAGKFQVELEADAFSGLYMALAKGAYWSEMEPYFQATFDAGDYMYNSRDHHGTPQQRMACAHLGVTAAAAILNGQLGTQYDQIHQYFIQEIRSRIAPRSGEVPSLAGSFPEIALPRLTYTQRQAYFPHE